MEPPERIHINLNGADGWELFEEHHIHDTHRVPPTPEQINRVLSSQVGRLFALMGWVENPAISVNLRITEADEHYIEVSNITQPFFAGSYSPAVEPPAIVTGHGDYIFDLVIVDLH